MLNLRFIYNNRTAAAAAAATTTTTAAVVIVVLVVDRSQIVGSLFRLLFTRLPHYLGGLKKDTNLENYPCIDGVKTTTQTKQ